MSRPRYKWWGYVKAMIRAYPSLDRKACQGTEARECAAVCRAKEATCALPDGEDRLRLVDMVFFRQTHTLDGAAQEIPCSPKTAQRWHRDFIRQVAKEFGLLESWP